MFNFKVMATFKMHSLVVVNEDSSVCKTSPRRVFQYNLYGQPYYV